MTDRRALLIGVETYLDEALTGRPGTSVCMGRVARRLELGQWEVALLTDTAAAGADQPLLSNVLGRLDWLSQADEVLVVFSGHVRDDRLLLRDARTRQLERTGLALTEVVDVLPPKAGVLVDGPVSRDALVGVSWASAWAPEQEGASDRPSPYLAAIAHGLGTDSVSTPLTGIRLMAQVAETLGASTEDVPAFWISGDPTGSVLVSAPADLVTCGHCLKVVEQAAASYCPHCGRAMASSGFIDGGRYELLETLGQGGMGQVYLAHDTRLGCERALKLLSVPEGLDVRDAEILRARLIQEARAAQTLADKTHHVVRVFDVGHSAERDVPFLVMEVLRGETLQSHIARGPMAVEKAVSIAYQIAKTLAVAHPKGMIHRDLKPSNVMLVERDGEKDFVKLLDFGLVKVENAELLTESGCAMGTLQYMPPEQLQGQKVDARADVFALGAVLYECLTGVRANPGKAHHEIFRVLLDVGVEPIAQRCPDLPEGLAGVVDRCLKLDMESRYADGGAVMRALEAFLVDDTLPRGTPASPSAEDDPPSDSIGTDRTVAGWRAADAVPIDSTPSLATGEISPRAVKPEVRRWPLPAAVVFVIGAGLYWGVGGEPRITVADAGVVNTVAAPSTSARVPDAGPTLDAKTTPQIPSGPSPLARPAGVLPADIEVLRRLDGDGVFYQTADPLHAFAALVRDVTLGTKKPPALDSAADDQWRALPSSLRTWLAEGVELDGIEAHATGVRLSQRHLEGLRAMQPRRHKIRRLGRIWVDKHRAPIFAAVNCRGAKTGDRLVTARWEILGYSGGRCTDRDCPRALARGLQKARELGEQLRLTLVLERPSKAGDASSNPHARCVLR